REPHVFRLLLGALGGRYAGSGIKRVRRAVLVFKRRAAAHREPAPYRTVFTAGFQHAAIRSARGRSGDIHAALVERLDSRLGGGSGTSRIFLPGQFEGRASHGRPSGPLTYSVPGVEPPGAGDI